ncbi:MAG: MOSC domain-containing protein [Acidimicrobiia bacterium]
MTFRGTLAAIYTAPSEGDPTVDHAQVRAVAGVGLDGDRYAADRKEGKHSFTPGTGREVTLIEREAVAAVRNETCIDVSESQTRRNLVTEGVPLNHLVGHEFMVGKVRLRGVRLAEPCAYLEGLVGEKGLRKAFVHRGGLRAEIVEGGTLRVGDSVEPVA